MSVLLKNISYTALLILVLFNACTSSPPPQLKTQVLLNSEMIINENACGNAVALVDEQEVSKFPSPSSSWILDRCNKKLVEIPSAIIDLGSVYEITAIHYYDTNGEGSFEVSDGTPFHWKNLFTDPMTGYQQWKTQKINITTRYLQLKSATRIFPSEILVEGTRLEQPLELSSKSLLKKSAYPLIKDFLGTNAFVDDPIGLLAPFGAIREYHPWADWNQIVKGEIVHNPTSQNFNFDLYYQNTLKAGITVCPVLQQSPFWISELKNKESKPLHPGANPDDPASYSEHAQFMFQYAARYGYGKTDINKLTLAPNQERICNLQMLHYYENWNEQDKWWRGKESYFAPYEYAAMSSADYDGHLGKVEGSTGIKNADPAAKLVMGGLANPNLDYIKALKYWSDHYRKGQFLWSVINIHHYSNDGGGQFQSKKGISPEDDRMKEKLEKFTAYRNRYLPGVELWLSEFGYDIKDDSPQKAMRIGSMNPEEVQGIWLVRSFMAAAAAGIDKAFQFMIRDTEITGIYASSGLYYWKKNGENKEAQLRPAWYYLHTMKKVLGSTRFDNEIKSGNPDIDVYAFNDEEKPGRKIYAIWCKTSSDKKIKGFSFTLPFKSKYAWKVLLQDRSSMGILSSLNITANKVSVDVSEKPLFIVLDNEQGFNLPKDDRMLKLSQAMMVCEGKGKLENLTDEQDIIGNPDMGIYSAKPKTNWEVPYNQWFPLNAHIDLGKEYEVTKVYINDGPGNGELVISTGSPDKWEKVSKDDMYSYNTWKPHIINKKTRYIQLSRASANVGIFEVAVYVE